MSNIKFTLRTMPETVLAGMSVWVQSGGRDHKMT